MTQRRPNTFTGLRAMLLLSLTHCASCPRGGNLEKAQEHNYYCGQYIAEGKFVEAEARCRLALEYVPSYDEPYNNLGLIAYNKGQNEKAVSFFKKAIALRGDFAEAHNNLGAVFMDERQYAPAEAEFRSAIEVDPGYINARINLGLVLLYVGRAAESRDQYIRCAEIDPDACDCRMGLGVLDINTKDWDSAKTQFQKLTDACPGNAEGHYNLCFTYLNMGRCLDAIDSCTSAFAIKPDYIEARQNLTKAYECAALQDGAIAKFIGQIRDNPGDASLHYRLAIVYKENSLLDRAVKELEATIKLDKRHELAHYELAVVFNAMLDTQRTISACQRFVDLVRDPALTEKRDWCVNRVRELRY